MNKMQDIQEHHISRKEFKDIMSEAIDYSIDLEKHMIKSLNKVARNQPYVAFGIWTVSNDSVRCGCPAVEAGLTSPSTEISWRVLPFTQKFDALVEEYIDFTKFYGRNWGILFIDD